MAVHVVGNVCLDTTFRLERFPRPGETVNAGGCAVGLGGKGANQAVGADAEGADVRRRLVEVGLSDRGLAVVDAPTDRSSVLLDAAGENLIVSAVDAARLFPADRGGWREAAASGDVLVMQNNLSACATIACLRHAAAAGLYTVFNASPLGTGDSVSLEGVDLVVVNRDEGERLTGRAAARDVAASLLGLGARRALVTLGPHGALLAEAGRDRPFSAPAVAPVDTSGAGDVLAGTLAGCIDRGHPFAAAIEIAIRAASLAVTRPGTFGSGPSHGEFASLISKEPA